MVFCSAVGRTQKNAFGCPAPSPCGGQKVKRVSVLYEKKYNQQIDTTLAD